MRCGSVKKWQFHREDSWCQPVLLRPDWLKGKQVWFLYDLVTVIRECRFFFRMESHWCMALGRQNLYEDLSARKPASCLVQGNISRITSNWSYRKCRLSDCQLIYADLLLRPQIRRSVSLCGKIPLCTMNDTLYYNKESIMKKRTIALLTTLALATGMVAGCGSNTAATDTAKTSCLLYTSPSPRD